MLTSPPAPPIAILSAAVAPPQAAAEYGIVVWQSAANKLQFIAGQASQWVGDHPGLFWAGVGLVLLVAWSTRPGPR
jgi:hypothetical protein